MNKDEAKKFIENLPSEAALIYDMLWSNGENLPDKLAKLARDAAAASEALNSLRIRKQAA
jgi:hypothetical protein